jgi:hypothetical protein
VVSPDMEIQYPLFTTGALAFFRTTWLAAGAETRALCTAGFVVSTTQPEVTRKLLRSAAKLAACLVIVFICQNSL